MKKIIFSATIVALAICSCSKLPLQKQFKYNPEPLDPHQGVSCWQFICENEDLATMKNAIELCGLSDYYSTKESLYTYLLLDETAFNSHILTKYEASSPAEIDPETLRDILLFHIIKGSYSSYYGTISYDPEHVITLWKSQDAVMTIKLLDTSSSHSQRQQDRVTLMDQCGSSTVVSATASDLLMTNGPAHILSRPCIYKK